jgi:hypothetical protein
MRKLALGIAVAVVMCLLSSSEARAFGRTRQGFGIGIGSGTIANGLSLKLMAGPGAFQVVAGVWGGGGARDRFVHADGIAGSLDYLFEMPSLAQSQYFSIDWSFGIGGGVGVPTFNGRLCAAVSGIAGLEFNFTTIPLDLTLEFRPSVGIIPDPGLNLVDFTAHLRLWF